MFDWLGTWNPEHIVGLVTAISAMVVAYWVKGRAKFPKPEHAPTGVPAAIRLHPMDADVVTEILTEVREARREYQSIIRRVEEIGQHTAILIDRRP